MTKQNLKIMIVLNAFELDGPGLLLENQCRQWLLNPELQIQVIALARDGALRERLEALGVAAEFIPARSPAQWPAFWRWLKELTHSNSKPDIIHTHLLWPDVVMRLFRSAVPDAALVSSCHGLHALSEKGPLLGFAYRLLDRVTRFRCDHWVAVSQNVGRQLRHYGVRKSQITLVPNGIDLKKFSPFTPAQRQTARALFGVTEEEFVILSVGNLRPVKGFDVALQAMAQLKKRHQNIRLLVLGSGPMLGDFQGRCGELNLRDCVEFRGAVTHLEKLYGGADCYLQPSRYESFGLAVAEALACKVPVVCSQTGALPELVIHGKTGRLFPVGDATACALEIEAVLVNQSTNRELADQGREHLEKRASVERSAARMVKFWRNVASH